MLHAQCGVPLAFFRAETARKSTYLQNATCKLRILLARDEPTGGVAQIGAVQIQPNAPNQVMDLRLAKAGVGARCVCLDTVKGRQGGVGKKGNVNTRDGCGA